MDDLRDLSLKVDALRETMARVDAHIAARDERDRAIFSHITELRSQVRKNSERVTVLSKDVAIRYDNLRQEIVDLRLWRAKLAGMMTVFAFVGGVLGSVVGILIKSAVQ